MKRLMNMNTKNLDIPPYFYIVNVEAAIFKEDKWLIIKRSDKEDYAGGTLSFVGGKVDDTSDQLNILESSLIREIFEEVGVEVEENIVYVNSNLFLANNIPVVDVVFLCRYKSGEPYRKSPDEVDSIYWMTTEEVITNPKTPIWLQRNIQLADNLRKQFSY